MESVAAAAVLVESGSMGAKAYQRNLQAGNSPIRVPGDSETVVATSAKVECPGREGKVRVNAWVEMETGQAARYVRLVIYEGDSIQPTPLYALDVNVGADSKGDIAKFEAETVQEFTDKPYVQYCFSVQQIDSTGDGMVYEYVLDTVALCG